MVTLSDSIGIRATPKKIFDWLTNLKGKVEYRAWHPDHVDLRWTRGKPFAVGSIVCFEENLHGKLHKARFLCTRVLPDEMIEYRPLFPWSLYMPRCTFEIKPTRNDSSIFTATIELRMGPLFKKSGQKKIMAIRKHMKEEGDNLKKLMEQR